MNLQAIETVVRRFFADEQFRAAVIADPATALAEYRLGEPERRALVKGLQVTPGGTIVGCEPVWWGCGWW